MLCRLVSSRVILSHLVSSRHVSSSSSRRHCRCRLVVSSSSSHHLITVIISLSSSLSHRCHASTLYRGVVVVVSCHLFSSPLISSHLISSRHVPLCVIVVLSRHVMRHASSSSRLVISLSRLVTSRHASSSSRRLVVSPIVVSSCHRVIASSCHRVIVSIASVTLVVRGAIENSSSSFFPGSGCFAVTRASFFQHALFLAAGFTDTIAFSFITFVPMSL